MQKSKLLPLLLLLAAVLLTGCEETKTQLKKQVSTVAMTATRDAAEAAAKTIGPAATVSAGLSLIATQCPLPVGHGAMMDSVEQRDSTVVFLCSVDEQQVSISFLAQNPQTVKARSMRMMQANSQAKLFTRMCAKAGYGFLYKYVGQTSGQSVEISVSNAELISQFGQQPSVHTPK